MQVVDTSPTTFKLFALLFSYAATWNRLIEYAEQLADIDKIKEAYEALLEAYPNAVSHEFLSAVIVY